MPECSTRLNLSLHLLDFRCGSSRKTRSACSRPTPETKLTTFRREKERWASAKQKPHQVTLNSISKSEFQSHVCEHVNTSSSYWLNWRWIVRCWCWWRLWSDGPHACCTAAALTLRWSLLIGGKQSALICWRSDLLPDRRICCNMNN